jgi:hypothetical protein
MDVIAAFGLSASAGLNAYIPLLVVSLLAKFTNLINLSESWRALESWWIIGLLIVLSLVEFLVDKIPAVNHINDIIQTLVRPTAGAILFAASAQAITEVNPILSIAIGLLVSGGVHAAKSVLVRPVTTVTTAGAGDVPVSVLEDVTATTISVLSVVIPILVAIILVVFLIGLIWWIANQSIEKTT